MKITSSVNRPLSWRASEIRDTTYIQKIKKATPKKGQKLKRKHEKKARPAVPGQALSMQWYSETNDQPFSRHAKTAGP
jgi:hypothetical protein